VKVLLLQDVKSIGRTGEVKDVSDGYFRNFLAPKGLATPATEGALKKLATERDSVVRRDARQLAENRKLADRVRETQVVLRVRVGDQHRLFGAVTSADIATELGKKLGIEIDKRNVELTEPIKHLGTYEVAIRLAHGIEPKAKVVVEPLESAAG
jgi:large subunit ribosomal protein L9